jgi:hypothetical protein
VEQVWADFVKAVQSADLPKFVREQAARGMQVFDAGQYL